MSNGFKEREEGGRGGGILNRQSTNTYSTIKQSVDQSGG